MKTNKRFFAVVLAVMMLALTLPFAASAADETYSLSLNSAKEGFAYDVYKVADLDLVTGNYENAASPALETAIGTGDSAAILAACDKLDSLGNAVGSYTTSDSGVKTLSGLTAGIYYIKNTEKPETVTSVANMIVPLPTYENGEWKAYDKTIELAAKISTEPKVSKAIENSKYTPVYTTAAIGEDVTFKLTASVAGTVLNKLDKYTITDTYEKGLTPKPETVTVALEKGGVQTALTDNEWSYAAKDGGFDIDFSADYLSNDAFYGYTNVVVTYQATLNEDAKIGAEGNENADGLVYKAQAETDIHTVPGNTVYVFTLQIDVTKIDAGTKKVIADKEAKFALLDAEKNQLAELATVNGVVSFIGLDKGTYFVKETQAPNGYNLNSTVFEVKLEPSFSTAADGKVTMSISNGEKFELSVEDTPAKLPVTGGMGNTLFTVIGASLILCAGVLFVIVMKKKSAK